MTKLKIIMGCMWSGKTTELIRECERYKSIGKKVLYISPIVDNRNKKVVLGNYLSYNLGKINTHNNNYVQCIKLESLNELENNWEEILKWDVFGIDEAQFFNNLDIVKSLVNNNKIVIVSGLDGDFKQEKFGCILNLIPICDDIVKLHALCKMCNDGTIGVFSKRIINNQDQTLIGGKDEYLAVCRKCLVKDS